MSFVSHFFQFIPITFLNHGALTRSSNSDHLDFDTTPPYDMIVRNLVRIVY
jgi:hypothetical protein